MIISLIVGGAVALTVGGGLIADKVNKKYDQSELEKTDENTLQQFDEEAFSEEQKAEFEESADMSVSDYQKIIAQMQEEIKAKKSEFNASKEGRGLLGTIGDGVKSLFGGGSKKVKNGIEDAEAKLNELIAKGENVTLSEIEEVYKVVMGADLDLAAVQATLDSTDGSYTVQQMNPDGTYSEVTYSKEDIVAKVQENAQKLQEKFDKTKSDQGWISKGLGFINNGLGIGTTGNEAQAKISAFIELAGTLSASDDDATFAAKFKSITGQELTEQAISTLMFDVDAYLAEYEANSTVELTDFEKEQIKDYYTMMGNTPANEAIMDYESTQDSIKEGFNTIVTTAVVVAAVAATPFSGGTSLAAIGACAAIGAGVGAATNVTLNATDGLTSADGYSLSEAGMDALKGGVTGALAGAGGGFSGRVAGAVGEGGKFAATKVGGMVMSKVSTNVATGVVTGAAYGAASSAANYTLDTAIKNQVIDGDIVQNLGQQYTDEQGRTCIQYPVVDDNGDLLYYETHVYSPDGEFVEKFTSNDFSFGGLVSNTATGAVVGGVAGGVAGKAGFKFGQTDGSVGSRLASGTKIGAMGGATGGAASGVTNWAQSGFEGGASGLVDNVVDGTLEGTATGAAAGFAVAGGQIAGEKAAPKVLNHIEKKYEQAHQRKLAADNNAPKPAEGDPDGADAPKKTKAQERADKRVEKYDKLYKAQCKNVSDYADKYIADADEAAAKYNDSKKTSDVPDDAPDAEPTRKETKIAKQKEKAENYKKKIDEIDARKTDFDARLQKGEVDSLETTYDKVRAAGDDFGAKAKARGAEIKEDVKAKGAEIKEGAKAKYASGKESAKANWETVKSEKGLWNKFKAVCKIGKNSVSNSFSKITSKFTKTETAATDAATDPKDATSKGTHDATKSASTKPKARIGDVERDDSYLNHSEKLEIQRINNKINEYKEIKLETGHAPNHAKFCDKQIADLQEQIDGIYNSAYDRNFNHEIIKLMRDPNYNG